MPQIQKTLRVGSGQTTLKGWNVSTERPKRNPCQKIRNSSRSEPFRNRLHDENADSTHDMVTGDNESPVMVPEFLTGRVPSRTALNQSHDDHNPLLDTTVPAQAIVTPVAVQGPIDRLADVLTNLQNRPTACQLIICPVNSNTMTFDGKSEKLELFEDFFHTMIKMPEQMKINHFHSLLRKGALQTFRNISTVNRQTLEDVLVIFRRKYVKPESPATAKHKWHPLLFDPNTMKLTDFLEELNQVAEKAFGDHAQN